MRLTFAGSIAEPARPRRQAAPSMTAEAELILITLGIFPVMLVIGLVGSLISAVTLGVALNSYRRDH